MPDRVKRVTVTVEFDGTTISMTNESWSTGGNPIFVPEEATAGLEVLMRRMRPALDGTFGRRG